MSARTTERSERGDTLVEVLISLVVIALTAGALLGAFGTSITASAEHKDAATLESVLKAFVEQATNQLGRQITTTLTKQIDNGPGNISLNVNSIPMNLTNGQTLQLFWSGNTQNVTVSGPQAASATPTTIAVSSFTANSTFDVGSNVIFPSTPAFTPCATVATYSGGGLSFPNVVTTQGTYTASITKVLFWDPGEGKFDLNDGDQDDPCNTAVTPPPQQLLTATATNITNGTTTSVDFVVSDPNFDPAPPGPPSITAQTDTIVAGVPSSYSISAGGSPSPSLSASGQPSWAILVDNGGGHGTLYFDAPSSATGHSFSFMISATNSDNGGTTVPNPPQNNFTVTVGQTPTITSADNDTIVPGVPMTPFTVTTTGSTPISLSQTGIPPWATFTPNANGTATLSGTPPATGETDTFTIGAQNAAGSVSQNFTLLVSAIPAAPVFATAASDDVPINEVLSFPIAAAGSPSPVITETGALPNGVTFTGGTGSASLSGTPTVSGNFPITLTASNDLTHATDATQSFVLTVDPQSTPAITGPSNAAPACGQTNSTFQFTVVGMDFQSGVVVTSAGMTGTVIAIVIDSSHLTVVGTGSSAGTYSMTVTNPDGGTDTQSRAVSIMSGQC